jgi:AcrR family transcriptional regulator
MPLSGKRAQDRRVQKTRKLLHDALFSLVHEKNYDSIVVKEILNRANVGRSTFYMHFRDKDELLVSGMLDMLRPAHTPVLPSAAKPQARTISFSLPIFEHIHQHRSASGAMIGSRGRAVLHEHLQKALAELIGDDVKKYFRGHRKPAPIPLDLLVQYLASAFILTLNWWVDSKSSLHPKDVDKVFRALVLPTLAAAFE